ncbi:general secretion pathway protein GspB [Thermomonas sp.]|uniref:general secretion pathway protein GspB n=1 Tax=Thermomonas sp. TaxID=1971895 RepID=UPI0035B4F2A8
MSLILEALRKSEAERRRDSTPDVAMELPPAPARRTRPIPWLVWPVVVAFLGLLALAGWMGKRAGERDRIAPPATTAPAPVIAAPAIATQPVALPPAATPPATADLPAVQPPPATPSTLPAAVPPASTARAVPAATGATPDIATTALPPVKLSMHMWDADAGKRFVILDGQRMGEGDRNGTLQVIAIDRKGVVIERDGQRAHIPLP